MALLFPPPALSPKLLPFPSSLRSSRPPRITCTSSSTTATENVSSAPPPSPAAPSPSTSSPAGASDGAGGGKSKKNRRPLKPSFQEKALRRWSARAPSQRASFPWQQQEQPPPPPHRVGQESDGARGKEPGGGGSSATLRSIVDYFGGGSSDDGDDGVPEEGGAGKNGAARDEATQDGEEGSHFPPRYLLGSRAVAAPWMHGEGSAEDQCVSGSVVAGAELGVDMDDVADDELSLVDGDEEEVVSGEEPLSVSSEEEMYEDYAAPTANSSYGMDLVVDRGSKGDGFDRSLMRSSVRTIVRTLRNSMEESIPNVATERCGGDDFVQKMGSVLLPWEREGEDEEEFGGGRPGRRSNTELAERTIPEPELRRLRDAALRMKERIKVGPGGVTQDIVESIHSKWKVEDVVKMRFEGPPSLNMKRTHDLLEDRTGGIVIWRSGRTVVLYRGMNYNLRCVQSYAKITEIDSNKEVGDANIVVPSRGGHDSQKSRADNVKRSTSIVNSYLEDTGTFDIDNFLDQLGPRYRDWSGRSPIPVDADLLPSVVPGYKPPFRLLPHKIKSTLRNKEMTALRRLARQTAPHFTLGRNREHQGLATAIVKLWEKSAIAKIAIKRGVPNTCNDRMAEEIKKLTGGVLLSRNKEYIVFYRGNDFITPKVREVLVEKQEQAITQQDEEELARLKASASIATIPRELRSPLVAGTLAETTEAKSRWGNSLNDEQREDEMKRLALVKHASLLKNLRRKLFLAKTKVAKAEKALAKVQEFLSPAELPTDLETVTDEERFLFRRIGLKMSAFLMLGRREVFDGTVQNMHFHWKHRELVKIIVKGKNFAQVKHIAISLEAESGGVLISLDKTSKGYAIIFYRGKNYRRPQIMKPRNLLTRRQALARSIELQRREALKHHISSLQDKIWKLNSQLVQMKAAREKQDVKLLQTVEDDLSSDDDNVEDEGDEAYLQTYSSDDEEDADDDSNEYL